MSEGESQPVAQCGACGRSIMGWRRTPRGRRFCPHCSVIRAADRRGNWEAMDDD